MRYCRWTGREKPIHHARCYPRPLPIHNHRDNIPLHLHLAAQRSNFFESCKRYVD